MVRTVHGDASQIPFVLVSSSVFAAFLACGVAQEQCMGGVVWRRSGVAEERCGCGEVLSRHSWQHWVPFLLRPTTTPNIDGLRRGKIRKPYWEMPIF